VPVYSCSTIDYSDLALGKTIRQRRKARGWTLRELAGRLGISVAGLSAIETEKARVDLEQLVNIAEALGVRLDEMLPASPSRHYLVMAKSDREALGPEALTLVDRASGKQTSHHARVVPLAEAFVGKHLEPYQIDVPPVPDDQIRLISHDREEFVFVTAGRLEVLLRTPDGPVSEVLAPGDCMYFRSHLPHCLRAAAGRSATAIDLVYTPYRGDADGRARTAIYSSRGPRTTAERIGDQIAALRASAGLSMHDFARELSVSARQLADIERGRRPVPIELLLRACRRFRRPLEYFMSRAVVERPFFQVQRAAAIGRLPLRSRKRLVQGASRPTEFRSLAAEFGPRGMYPYYVRLRLASQPDVPLHEHHGQEFAYVLTGEVTLTTIVDGRRVTEQLTAGDACFIDATVPHRFSGRGASPYNDSSAEIIDVFWCPLGESYLFDDD
jgi:transcriptional regulator with XRE-family HTH domain/quercetin dioxygenase-like cupin family protein